MNDHPEDRPSPTFTSAREAALDEQASMDDSHDEWDYFDDDEGESK
jgi:hypothetical protein